MIAARLTSALFRDNNFAANFQCEPLTLTEVAAMELVGLSKTQSRQLIGVLNEQASHADYMRRVEIDGDELEIALDLSRMPMGILRKSYRCPDQALAELVSDVTGAPLQREAPTSKIGLPEATIYNLFPGPEKD
jgi:hypothetical protein